MKNTLKKNKKGFTLVELLAVIVILALLIVVTANTVLPMMNKSKQNAMVVYAERVLNTASSFFQADSITDSATSKNYSIAELMGEDNYYGCVNVEKNGDGFKYSIAIFKDDDQLGLVETGLTGVVIDGKAAELSTDENYTKKKVTSKSSVAKHSNCTDTAYTLNT